MANSQGGQEEEEEEDDYMNMTFDDPSTATTKGPGRTSSSTHETSLQRRQRLKREGEIRGRPKSKAELAAEAAAEREAALNRSLIEQDRTALRKSKGLAMMAKMGFKPGSALGARPSPPPPRQQEQKQKQKSETDREAEGARTAERAKDGDGDADGYGDASGPGLGATTTTTAKVNAKGGEDFTNSSTAPRTEPIRLEMKEDRGGIGLDSERKRKIHEAYAAQDKRARTLDAGEFRDRGRRERELARAEKQCWAAMKVCEKLFEDRARGIGPDGGGGGGEQEEDVSSLNRASKRKRPAISSRPLKGIPVEWRGLIRAREEAERDRRMRHDLEKTSRVRLPTYDDDTEDADDRTALGKSALEAYVPVEDLEDEDEELEEFTSLEADEKLRRMIVYLRTEHNYCFWCKYQYDDDSLDGCPGLTEEDHD